MFTRKSTCQFEIYTDRPGVYSWGYWITVRLPEFEGSEASEYHYQLGQSYGLNTGYYCTWELSDRLHNVVLNGRLVEGRTDPFAPLMKCLAFLEAKHGGEE